MKKRLLLLAAVISVSVGSIGSALINNEPAKNNQVETSASVASESSLNAETEIQPTESTKVTEAQVTETNQASTPAPSQSEPIAEPFDAQLYAQAELEVKSKQGFSVNADCFNKLVVESTTWNITQSEVDNIITKVFGQYPSTCAAYNQYKMTGSF